MKKSKEKTDARPGRGGFREGAGRPAVETKIKRVPLQGARIPGWLMGWLKTKGDMGRKIETSLTEFYNLEPPNGALEKPEPTTPVLVTGLEPIKKTVAPCACPSDAMFFVSIAISQLERIHPEDPLTIEALERLENWITNRKQQKKRKRR